MKWVGVDLGETLKTRDLGTNNGVLTMETSERLSLNELSIGCQSRGNCTSGGGTVARLDPSIVNMTWRRMGPFDSDGSIHL